MEDNIETQGRFATKWSVFSAKCHHQAGNLPRDDPSPPVKTTFGKLLSIWIQALSFLNVPHRSSFSRYGAVVEMPSAHRPTFFFGDLHGLTNQCLLTICCQMGWNSKYRIYHPTLNRLYACLILFFSTKNYSHNLWVAKIAGGCLHPFWNICALSNWTSPNIKNFETKPRSKSFLPSLLFPISHWHVQLVSEQISPNFAWAVLALPSNFSMRGRSSWPQNRLWLKLKPQPCFRHMSHAKKKTALLSPSPTKGEKKPGYISVVCADLLKGILIMNYHPYILIYLGIIQI